VSLAPRYAPEVMIQLENVEQDASRSRLWDAICDAIDLICDYPESGGARRYMWRRDGGPVWQLHRETEMAVTRITLRGA
jgi:hypothetical protein